MKVKPTSMRVVGGKSYSFKADAATICKLQYLAKFYEVELGVKVSTSSILRRAVDMLTQEADALITFTRVAPRAQEVKNEKVLIAIASRGYAEPAWAGGPPPIPAGDTAVFPRYEEIEKHSRASESATTPTMQLPRQDYE